MKVYFATDHAGFALKNELLAYVRDELTYDVEDCGTTVFDADDDYPDYIKIAAGKISKEPHVSKAIIIGASGQGEAIVANRYAGVRAVVYYGEPTVAQTDATGNTLSIITGSRNHNDANILSLGARFISVDEAKRAVKTWLTTDFSGEPRHIRRIKKIDGA